MCSDTDSDTAIYFFFPLFSSSLRHLECRYLPHNPRGAPRPGVCMRTAVSVSPCTAYCLCARIQGTLLLIPSRCHVLTTTRSSHSLRTECRSWMRIRGYYWHGLTKMGLAGGAVVEVVVSLVCFIKYLPMWPPR